MSLVLGHKDNSSETHSSKPHDFSLSGFFDDAYNKGVVTAVEERPKEAAVVAVGAAAGAAAALCLTRGLAGMFRVGTAATLEGALPSTLRMTNVEITGLESYYRSAAVDAGLPAIERRYLFENKKALEALARRDLFMWNKRPYISQDYPNSLPYFFRPAEGWSLRRNSELVEFEQLSEDLSGKAWYDRDIGTPFIDRVSSKHVTNQDMPALLEHCSLSKHLHLNLAGSDITDQALYSLPEMQGKLRLLNVKNTHITSTGIKWLRQALPDLAIEM